MGMSNPASFDALIFKEHFTEGEPFFLVNAKVVHTGDTAKFDDDRMVVLTIAKGGEEKEYTLFGRYVVAQVENANPREDFRKPWKIVTGQPSEGKRPGKMLVEADADIPF